MSSKLSHSEIYAGLGRDPAPEAAVCALAERLAANGVAGAPIHVSTVDGHLSVLEVDVAGVEVSDAYAERGLIVAVDMAEAVSDLHAAGVVHGGLTTASFVVDGGGRVRSRHVGLAVVVDGRDVIGPPPSRHDDVAALCDSIGQLLERDPRPDHRARRVLRRHRRHPTDAGRLAQDLRAVCSTPPARRPSRAHLCWAVALVVLITAPWAYAAVVGRRTHSHPRPAAAEAGVAASRSVSVHPCTAAALPAEAGASIVVADIVQAGCLQPVEIAGGSIVARGPDGTVARFAIGAPGDQVVLGHWSCSKVSLPAVYRPADGSLYLFTSWAWEGTAPGRSAVAQSAPAVSTAVAGGTARAEPVNGSCQHVEVVAK